MKQLEKKVDSDGFRKNYKELKKKELTDIKITAKI